jgi:hypothetical protein
MNSRNVSSLRDATHTQRLLNKIKALYAARPRALEIEIEGVRLRGQDLFSVVIDAEAADDNLEITREDGGGVEYFDTADIQKIKRLRSRKWLIVITPGADDAEATA